MSSYGHQPGDIELTVTTHSGNRSPNGQTFSSLSSLHRARDTIHPSLSRGEIATVAGPSGTRDSDAHNQAFDDRFETDQTDAEARAQAHQIFGPEAQKTRLRSVITAIEYIQRSLETESLSDVHRLERQKDLDRYTREFADRLAGMPAEERAEWETTIKNGTLCDAKTGETEGNARGLHSLFGRSLSRFRGSE
ncbi:hypothetical protein I316_00452 [Kwoniella heveanensis BCC8398]|uniref:Uncharacterized protein n=1 Tax=Kwoniella heveanensis BCC8398 TaxID=1296120 RepID=A0A1B9H4M6_9TREE|nr:hypothetical protein I316_00452 [Kwoniella heveanensis BCC8398]